MIYLVETIGYVGRLLSSFQSPNFTQGPYIIQSALLLIAPAFLAASIYMTLGRIIEMIDAEKYSVIPLKWLTKLFVFGDVLSFLMQASGKQKIDLLARIEANLCIGAGLMVSSSSGPSTGEHIIIGGLFVQIIFFGFFTITAVVFQARLSRSPTPRSLELSGIWRRHMIALYIGSVFILIRSVIRVVEYIEGYDGFLMKHEVFIYIFDALLMFIVMVTLQWCHPSEVNCLLGRGHKYAEKAILTREFVPGSALEMVQSGDV